MAVILELDSPVTFLEEKALSYHRTAAGHAPFSGKYRLHYWGTSESMTLASINGTPDFANTKFYEFLKFRLSDCLYDEEWWDEVPESRSGDSDFFFNAIVKNSYYSGQAEDILKNLPAIRGQNAPAVGQLVNATPGDRVSVLQSKSVLPSNTGYYLRFRVEGRET
jgi:hypothetical protein